MAVQETNVLSGTITNGVCVNADWIISNPVARSCVGQALVRRHSTQGPYIAYFGSAEVSVNRPSVEPDSVARRIATTVVA
jgi:hypothetical protein